MNWIATVTDIAVLGTSNLYQSSSGVEPAQIAAGPVSVPGVITAADLAFAGGAVTVATPDPSTVTVDGALIATAFGATPFSLADQGGGLFAQVTDQTGAGPNGTTLLGKYLALDSGSATPASIAGSVGAGYGTADGSGTCTVAFQVTLAP